MRYDFEKMNVFGIRSVLAVKLAKVGYPPEPRGRRARVACDNMPAEGVSVCGCGVSSRAHRRKNGRAKDIFLSVHKKR